MSTKATTHLTPFDKDNMPELTDEQQARADKIEEGYHEDNRPTVVLPGSHGTVSGTAVSEWVDENGEPKYSDVTGADERSDS